MIVFEFTDYNSFHFPLLLGENLRSVDLINLDYNESMQDFYQKLSRLPGFVLLESTDKVRGRYDILSAYPYDRIIINEHMGNRDEWLARLYSSLPIESAKTALPFEGGAIGYISYDFGAQLFGIKSTAQPDLRDMPLLNLGLYDWGIVVDHHLKKTTLCAMHRHQSTQEIVKEICSLWRSPDGHSHKYSVDSAFKPLISNEEYHQAFSAIHQYLNEGRSYQVNLTQPFHADYSGSTWGMYRKVTSTNPVPYSAFLRTEQAEVLSFSPERFLVHDQGHLLTSPIKGTIRRSSDQVEDEDLKKLLYLCPKNRAENIMIVDLLRNDLGKIAQTNSVKVSNLCAVQSFNSVHHLVSDIEALAKERKHPFELFFSCFPGGSITGAPKRESMYIIDEQELYARGIYCGSIGYFSHNGRFDSNIAIRTITARQNIAHLAAGGGIVIDSKCEDEYLECYTKIAAIINGLIS